jgi:hypothetical protein
MLNLKGKIMYPKISVNLGNLVLSLSDALDLAFGVDWGRIKPTH